MTPTREDAWALLTEYTSGEGLLKHALAVEVHGRARPPRRQSMRVRM